MSHPLVRDDTEGGVRVGAGAQHQAPSGVQNRQPVQQPQGADGQFGLGGQVNRVLAGPVNRGPVPQ